MHALSSHPRSATPDPAPILVVAPAWVGDMVMANSLFRLLRERHPRAPIDVLAPPWTAPLATRMPEIRQAHVLGVGHGQLQLATRIGLGRRLREERYGQAILLPNTLKSALTPFAAKIPRRTGYRGEFRYGLLNDVRRLDRTRLPLTVERFLALGMDAHEALPRDWSKPRLVVDPDSQRETLARLALVIPDGPLLALCPGAEFGPAKRWPVAHFVTLAQRWQAEGGGVWLFGSPKDRVVSAAIADQVPGAVDLTGRTGLAEAVDLLALSTAVVSNDSGLMHAAAALDRPLVALFGSSSASHTPPLGQRQTVLSLALDCQPCFRRECPLGHLRCLTELAPERVWSALGTLLE